MFRTLKCMITLSLGCLCTALFNLNSRFNDFHTLFAAEIRDSLFFSRSLGGKVFLQWTDTPNVLLAMKYLRETESMNGPSGATGCKIHGNWFSLDVKMDTGAAQQR